MMHLEADNRIDVPYNTSPLADSLARLNALQDYYDMYVGSLPGAGWVTSADLVDPNLPDLGRILEAIGSAYEMADRQFMVSFFLNGYGFLLAAAALGCFVLDERVPDLSPANVRVRLHSGGYVDGISFTRGRFWALSEDDAAGHPAAQIVANRDELREVLRHQLEAHTGALIPALRAQSSFGSRALWITIADRCAGLLVWLHQQRPDLLRIEQLVHETEALLQVPDSPFKNKLTGVNVVQGSNGSEPVLQRGACCLNYRRPDGQFCQSCPLAIRS